MKTGIPSNWHELTTFTVLNGKKSKNKGKSDTNGNIFHENITWVTNFFIVVFSGQFIFASFLLKSFLFCWTDALLSCLFGASARRQDGSGFPLSTFTPIMSVTHTKTHMPAHSLSLTLIHQHTHSRSRKPRCWVTAPQQNNVSSVAMEISRYDTGMEYELVGSQWRDVTAETSCMDKPSECYYIVICLYGYKVGILFWWKIPGVM